MKHSKTTRARKTVIAGRVTIGKLALAAFLSKNWGFTNTKRVGVTFQHFSLKTSGH